MTVHAARDRRVAIGIERVATDPVVVVVGETLRTQSSQSRCQRASIAYRVERVSERAIVRCNGVTRDALT